MNFAAVNVCGRCGANLRLVKNGDSAASDFNQKLNSTAFWLLKRFLSAAAISLVILIGVYLSMIYSAATLSAERREQVLKAVEVLESRGFTDDAFYLRLAVFRGDDNWFNKMVGHADAYAATNFPFEIVTLYEEFFTLTVDDTERASILLHEAQHLKGAGEMRAYEYVWRNRQKLGYDARNYEATAIYQNTIKSTKQYAFGLFICEGSKNRDCTE